MSKSDENKLEIPDKVLELLRHSYFKQSKNKELITDKDYNNFSEDVANVTGHGNPLHCNTWKRVFRHLTKPDGTPFEPSANTCRIIADYLGCNSWDELIKNLDETYEYIMSGNANNNISTILPPDSTDIMIKSLKKGDIIEVNYHPNRVVLLEFIRKDWYKVVSSKNSTLEQGDTINISMFTIGYPLMVSDLVRNGVSKGKYQSAQGHVILSVKLKQRRNKFDF